MAVDVLPIIAGILVLGIGVQLLARRLGVPSVLFLILVGLGIGDAGLNFVTLETFGAGLSVVVGLSVSVIVFDGAFGLRSERVRQASRATVRLVTVGAVLTFAGTAVAVRAVVGAEWPIALLVGALLVATGPTVVTPILEVVHVRDHVAAVLETEGIVNDVTAAIAAVVIFDVLVVGEGGLAASVASFLLRLGVGVGVGAAVAVVIHRLLVADVTPGEAPQAARFLFLAAAVGSYGIADAFAPEAGIAAAATAGVVLGNREVPHRETMERFGRDATLVVLSFVFISLAALIDLSAIRALGLAGIGVALAVALVVRPLVVGVSTYGLPRFTRDEQLFLSLVAPRGIIPASVATLFAVELSTTGASAAGQTLLGAVFVVIFATVVLEAGFARQIGDFLGVTPMKTIIVGGGRVGRALATRLEQRGEHIVVVEWDDDHVEDAREAGLTVHAGDGTDPDVLAAAGADDAKRVVAATADDDRNLLVCQLARSRFEVDAVFSRINDPTNVAAFDSLDVTGIDAPTATAVAIDNEIERPALTHWLSQLGEGHDAQEVEVTAERYAGETIRELNAEMPDGCIVAVIGKGPDSRVPDADDVIEIGDHVTFLGDREAVHRAVDRFHPHD